MQTIILTGKRELDIYINPQRQRLLRALALAGAPMTPKRLSETLGISPSAVQHHIQKLVALGVVGESHTERIHGITAHYYMALPITVRVGYGTEAGCETQRIALMQNGVNAVWQGFADHLRGRAASGAAGEPAPDDNAEVPSALAERPAPAPVNDLAGDVLWGIAHLTDDEARQVLTLIRGFLHEHDAPAPGRTAWEYALIAYPAKEGDHA